MATSSSNSTSMTYSNFGDGRRLPFNIINRIILLKRHYEYIGPYDGMQTQYRKGGKKRSRTRFNYDNEDVVEETWYPNGKRSWRTQWKGGKKVRIEEWWDNGNPHWSCTFSKGKKHGLEEWWHPDGLCLYQLEWVHGKQEHH
ncbi:MAG: toxin-antitoxin system YwqK family antitoxin [Promethearchaeota archaeon]